ncbi:MAG: hypothetical protein J2O49_00720 [Sciscionella sp.]|nr:hypothetical protein [Sciscionella sp.]
MDELQGRGGANIGNIGDDENAADRRAGHAQQERHFEMSSKRVDGAGVLTRCM